MATRRLRSRADLNSQSAFSKPAPSASSTSRPRRGAAATAFTASSSATIQRSSDDRRLSMQLTVKAPPEKLREATSRSSRNGRDSFQGGEIISGPRSTRNRKVVVEESSEEEEQDDDAEGEEIEVEEDEDIDMDDEDDEDAEGEEDEDMDDPPLPTHMSSNRNPPKPSVKVTPADIVEAKEMAMVDDPSDDESSELSEADEDEEGLGDEDAEGEELDEDEEDAEGDEDSELDSPSGSGTPDMSKLTRRQRKAYEEYDGGLMALSNGTSQIRSIA